MLFVHLQHSVGLEREKKRANSRLRDLLGVLCHFGSSRIAR